MSQNFICYEKTCDIFSLFCPFIAVHAPCSNSSPICLQLITTSTFKSIHQDHIQVVNALQYWNKTANRALMTLYRVSHESRKHFLSSGRHWDAQQHFKMLRKDLCDKTGAGHEIGIWIFTYSMHTHVWLCDLLHNTGPFSAQRNLLWYHVSYTLTATHLYVNKWKPSQQAPTSPSS